VSNRKKSFFESTQQRIIDGNAANLRRWASACESDRHRRDCTVWNVGRCIRTDSQSTAEFSVCTSKTHHN